MSLIESAKTNFEGKLNASPQPTLNCLQFEIDGTVIDILWEVSCHYGSFMRQALINGCFDSPVDHKYSPGKKVPLDCSSSKLGVREFEKGDVLYEFIIKPYGLPFTEKKGGFIHTFDLDVIEFLKSKGIKYTSYAY